LLSTSCTLYLDASGDPGWYPPDGSSKEEWYVFGGLALFPQSDHKAHIEVEKIINKHIPSNMLETIPIHEFEINYSHIIYGKRMYKQIDGIIRKQIADNIFDLIIDLSPVLFATAINKKQLKKLYGSYAYNPKDLALRSIIHRFSIYLEREKLLGLLVVDEEDYLKDKQMQNMISYYRKYGITIRGQNYRPIYENSLNKILNTIHFTPSYLSPGIQLADVCARATFMHYARNKSNRFNQLGVLWDRNKERTFEPVLFPNKERWIV
jgi:hypothetical protein